MSRVWRVLQSISALGVLLCTNTDVQVWKLCYFGLGQRTHKERHKGNNANFSQDSDQLRICNIFTSYITLVIKYTLCWLRDKVNELSSQAKTTFTAIKFWCLPWKLLSTLIFYPLQRGAGSNGKSSNRAISSFNCTFPRDLEKPTFLASTDTLKNGLWRGDWKAAVEDTLFTRAWICCWAFMAFARGAAF